MITSVFRTLFKNKSSNEMTCFSQVVHGFRKKSLNVISLVFRTALPMLYNRFQRLAINFLLVINACRGRSQDNEGGQGCLAQVIDGAIESTVLAAHCP